MNPMTASGETRTHRSTLPANEVLRHESPVAADRPSAELIEMLARLVLERLEREQHHAAAGTPPAADAGL